MSESDKPAEASFLSRWSRRKVEAAAQDAADKPSEPSPNLPSTPLAASAGLLAGGPYADQSPRSAPSTGAPPGTKIPETPHPEPTLPGETQANQALPAIDGLTHESDFSPFMAREVEPGLRNQAMKKLFTDPHYQFAQMDKLDIYIDDYSRPDPLPLEMLRQMNQAKSLFLFDDEVKDSSQQADAPLEGAHAAAALASERINTAGAKDSSPERAASVEADAGTAAAAGNDRQKAAGLAGIPGNEKST